MIELIENKDTLEEAILDSKEEALGLLLPFKRWEVLGWKMATHVFDHQRAQETWRIQFFEF